MTNIYIYVYMYIILLIQEYILSPKLLYFKKTSSHQWHIRGRAGVFVWPSRSSEMTLKCSFVTKWSQPTVFSTTTCAFRTPCPHLSFFLWQLLIMHIQQNCVIYNSSFRCLLGSVRSHFPAFQNVHSRVGKYVTRHSSHHFRSSNNSNYTFGLRVEIAPVEVFRGSVTE